MAEVTGGAASLHVPVMAERILELLAPALGAPGSVYVDGTLGMGGHAQLVLSACPQARLVGIDRDPDALALAGERLAPFGDRVALYEAVYDEITEVLAEDGTNQVVETRTGCVQLHQALAFGQVQRQQFRQPPTDQPRRRSRGRTRRRASAARRRRPRATDSPGRAWLR